MPKVGCFWPGLFKSSNCLFPWAAGETGKCSFFLLCNSHFSMGESELEGIMASPLPAAAGGLCCLALQAPRLGVARGLPPRGSPWGPP